MPALSSSFTLFVVFMVLKLTGVTAVIGVPLWIGFAVGLVFMAFAFRIARRGRR